jgi:hypothetical protein
MWWSLDLILLLLLLLLLRLGLSRSHSTRRSSGMSRILATISKLELMTTLVAFKPAVGVFGALVLGDAHFVSDFDSLAAQQWARYDVAFLYF